MRAPRPLLLVLGLCAAALVSLGACRQPHLPQLKQPKFMRWFDDDASTGAPQLQQRSGYLVSDHLDGINRVCIYDDLGSRVVVTGNSADLCPSSPQRSGGGWSSGAAAGALQGEYIEGQNKVCLYDRQGSPSAITIEAWDICPSVH
jgi:hypothetical protein